MSVFEAMNSIGKEDDEVQLRAQLRLAATDPYFKDMEDLNFQNLEENIIIEEEYQNDDRSYIPYVGKTFGSLEEAYKFYNDYALRVGFSVRKSSQTISKQGLSSKRFVCNEEGLSKREKKMELPIGNLDKPKTPEKEKGFTRIECKASCRVRLVATGSWEVSVFEEEHNHPLVTSPSKKRNLRSHKVINEEQVNTIRNLSAQNVGTSKILEYIAMFCGGKGNLHFKKQDVINVISTINRKLVGIDVSTTVLYFRKKQEEDPEFFFAIEPDDDGAAKHIFWVDGRARRAYQDFGDVVTFDTTYQTNKYGMPLAPFIDQDHHRISIFFGMALLRNESAPSFNWLFKTWLEAMYGKHPKAIITDQCPAMEKAIEQVFPNTIHRRCQWHVMRKAREKLGVLYSQLDGFGEKLGYVINRSVTIQEFEENWLKMVDDYKLDENDHIKNMFDKRAQWVPVYFREFFFADMSTTQRSESMNAMFKLWVHNQTSIYQFILQVEKIIEAIWQRESDEDLKTMNETPQLCTYYHIEVEARQVYTGNVFRLFKEILKESSLGFVKEIKRDAKYLVSIETHPLITNWVPESYIIEVKKETNYVSCTCKGTIFEGLLCSHSIKVMHHVGMAHLPPQYVLKRWTKNANARSKIPTAMRSMEPGESLELRALRVAAVKSDLGELLNMGSTSQEAFKLLKEIVSTGIEKLRLVVPKKITKQQDTETPAETEHVPMYTDPPQSQCKGRKKKPLRFKPAHEKFAKKQRTCSICNAKEGHNARTCPKRAQSKKKGTIMEEDEFNEDSYSSEDSLE